MKVARVRISLRRLSSLATSSSNKTSLSAFTSADSERLDSLKGKSLLRIDDYSPTQFQAILTLSHRLKQLHKHQQVFTNTPPPLYNKYKPLVGNSIAAIFQKRSTRTRVSTDTGLNLLGAHMLFLSTDDIQLGVNETVKDTALVLSRFNSLILARVYEHNNVCELSKHSALNNVPVINALSDQHHPLQALADIMTIQEVYSTNKLKERKVKVAYLGDGNNVAADLLLACALSGIDCAISSPVGYTLPKKVAGEISALANKKEARSLFVSGNSVEEAVRGASVIVTDTWVSMGQEKEKEERLNKFIGYQVTEKLIKQHGAQEDWKFMHCLPRHQEEVDDEVFYSAKRSLVFDEAENRMYTVMAVVLAMLGKTGAFVS